MEENDIVFYPTTNRNSVVDLPSTRGVRSQDTINENILDEDYGFDFYKNRIDNSGKYEGILRENYEPIKEEEVHENEGDVESHAASHVTIDNKIVSNDHENFVKKYMNYEFKSTFNCFNDKYDNENTESNDSDLDIQRETQHQNPCNISDRDITSNSNRRGVFPSHPSFDSNASFTSSLTSTGDKNGVRGLISGDISPRSKISPRISPRPLPDQSVFANAVGNVPYRGPATPLRGEIPYVSLPLHLHHYIHTDIHTYAPPITLVISLIGYFFQSSLLDIKTFLYSVYYIPIAFSQTSNTITYPYVEFIPSSYTSILTPIYPLSLH